jgi:mercuric ion transport protein
MNPPSAPRDNPGRVSGILAVGTGLSGLGAAAAASAASLCCIGPGVISVLGVGGAVAAAGLRQYRPVLLLGSLALLAVAFYLAYRAPAVTGASCRTRVGRLSRWFVWIAAALWLAAVVLPSVLWQ